MVQIPKDNVLNALPHKYDGKKVQKGDGRNGNGKSLHGLHGGGVRRRRGIAKQDILLPKPVRDHDIGTTKGIELISE